jgi:hypothetical protein
LTAAILVGLTGCGGGEVGGAAPGMETPLGQAFVKFKTALEHGDGATVYQSFAPASRDDALAGYAAVASNFVPQKVRLAKLDPMLRRHGAAQQLGWKAKGRIVAPVRDKGALLSELLQFIQAHSLAQAWLDAYAATPREVCDGMLMPLCWHALGAQETGNAGAVTAMVRHRKQAVRCTFSFQREGGVWYLKPPQAVWALVGPG